ncbi:protein HOTHEAD-like [Iris pallida]|uniref:Protein HOTHEAD-like n=1 Tax=Iris pallida TaxID=29817 RepID=A0AAX6FFY2_IRIPA|nr:protein HOTHEAD-like [Iris pallida]
MKDGSDAPTESYYDYIVVGGGRPESPWLPPSLGLQSPGPRERGLAVREQQHNQPLGFTSSLCDPSPTSPAQRFVSEEGVSNIRARVLGGGTCINAGFYSRASRDFVAEVGWDAALVNRSYSWVEDLLVQEPWVSSPWQSAARRGLVEAGVTPDNGFTNDHLVGTKYSGTTFDREGRRHTAADLLQQANPEGIAVLLNSTAHRILFTSKGRSRPIAYGVIFTDSDGAEHKAFLSNGPNNEIVVSAGTIGSPQLLMLSGVGPKDHLQSLGIDVVIDHPFVGQGIFDNPYNAITSPLLLRSRCSSGSSSASPRSTATLYLSPVPDSSRVHPPQQRKPRPLRSEEAS